MAGGRRRVRGLTLIELLIVVAIMASLAVVAFWGFSGVAPGYRLAAGARDVASVLVLTRARAISQSRDYIVELQPNGYRVIWDRTNPGVINVGLGGDEVTATGIYGLGVEYYRPGISPLPAGDFVHFDARGFATNMPPAGLRIGIRLSDGRSREVLVRYAGQVRKL